MTTKYDEMKAKLQALLMHNKEVLKELETEKQYAEHLLKNVRDSYLEKGLQEALCSIKSEKKLVADLQRSIKSALRYKEV